MRIQLKKMRTYLQNTAKVLSDLLKKVWKSYKPKQSDDTQLKSNDYFHSIYELPLYNWIKCINGELKFVRTAENGTNENDLKVWEKIYDTYLNDYGLGKLYLKLLKTMQKKAVYECEFILTNDRFKLTQIEMMEQKLNGMLNNNGSGVTIEQSLIHISKWLGQWINPKNITTKEYFDLQKEMDRYNKMNDGKKN